MTTAEEMRRQMVKDGQPYPPCQRSLPALAVRSRISSSPLEAP
jgi:hypothetical protein